MNRRQFLKSAALPLVPRVVDGNPRPRWLIGYHCEVCGACNVKIDYTLDPPDACRECGENYGFFSEVLNRLR